MEAAAVAVQHATLGHRQIGHAKGVDQHEIRQRLELEDAPLHRAKGCLVDIDGVDLAAGSGCDTPRDGVPGDLVVEFVPLQRRHSLRVADARNVAVGIEHHCRGHDWPGKTAAADLVHTCHVHEPHPSDGVLHCAESADLGHQPRPETRD